jgi:hypothetical protein
MFSPFCLNVGDYVEIIAFLGSIASFAERKATIERRLFGRAIRSMKAGYPKGIAGASANGKGAGRSNLGDWAGIWGVFEPLGLLLFPFGEPKLTRLE